MHGPDQCIEGFSRKTRKKELLGRLKCRWENNIKIYNEEILVGWGYGLE
jgi:hypothetical protein